VAGNYEQPDTRGGSVSLAEPPAPPAGTASLRVRLAPLVAGARAYWPRVWPWAPLLFATAYAVVVLVNFSSLMLAINQDSDAVVAPVIGKLLGEATQGGQVLLGNHAWYEELWFLRATSNLPDYRQLWELAPAAWSLLGLGVLAWSTWRALGVWAAALTASALLCVGAGGRFMFFTFNWHSLAAVHTILLGALLVWLAGRAERMRAWQLVLIAVLAGLVSAAPATGDQLFTYWAILPMVATAALLVWRTRSRDHWRVLAVAVAVAVIALAGGALLREAMHHHGWVAVPLRVRFTGPDAVVAQLVLLAESYLYLAGGDFFGLSTNPVGLSVFLSGVLFVSAVIAVALELRRRASSADPAPVHADPATARRFAYVAFWAISLLIAGTAFVFTTAAVNFESARFLLAGYIAVGALLPLVALRSRGWQASIVAGHPARSPAGQRAHPPGARAARRLRLRQLLGRPRPHLALPLQGQGLPRRAVRDGQPHAVPVRGRAGRQLVRASATHSLDADHRPAAHAAAARLNSGPGAWQARARHHDRAPAGLHLPLRHR
jgi:hypothetical protein